MIRITSHCFFILLCVAISSGGKAQSYQKTDLGIKTVINSTVIEIQFYSPSTVRILKSPADYNYTKESLSVIKKPEKTIFRAKQQRDLLNLKTATITVTLNLKSGGIVYSTTKGESLLKEKDDGVRFTPFNDGGNNTFTVQQMFVLDKDEAIYGLGTQQRGKMSQRNVTLNMVQGNTDDYIPFFSIGERLRYFLG